MSSDTQLLEILIARDDNERTARPSEDSDELDALLVRVPERTAASFSTGQNRAIQSALKKGILKKGEALRRGSAGTEPAPSSGT